VEPNNQLHDDSSYAKGTPMEALRLFLDNECGVTMIEYALLLTFIALVCFVVVGTLGGNVQNVYQNATDGFGGGS